MPQPAQVPATREGIEQHYDEYYADGASEWRRLGAVYKAQNIVRLWNRVGLPPKPSLCEVGCGEGSLLRELGRTQFPSRVAGFEISRSGLEVARSAAYTVPATFSQVRGLDLDAGDQSFDLAVLSHVLEHVDDPRSLLREAARVARYVFAEVPLELHCRTPRDFRWTKLGHINLYNSTVLRHLVQSCGMHVLAQETTVPGYRVYRYGRGPVGALLRYGLKAGLLRVAPGLAVSIFTYHGSLLATRQET